MAATAISLQLRTNKTRAIKNPSFFQLFSSSSTPEPPINAEDQKTSSPSQSRSSFTSYFSDVKASLKQDQSHLQPSPRKPFSFSSNPPPSEEPSKIASFEEIRKNLYRLASFEEMRKNLSEYRRRSAVPPPSAVDSSSSSFSPPPRSSQHISFEELYKRNVIPKNEESNTAEFPKSGKLSFEAIRESLKKLRMNRPEGVNNGNETMSHSKFKNDFLRPANSAPLFLRTDSLPTSVFGKETEKMLESPTMKTEFVRIYSYAELGRKLRKLRPEEAKKGEKWFSLGELNGRLVKLREMEEKESESRIGGVDHQQLRESLVKLRLSDHEKVKKKSIHRLDILGQLDGTTNFMVSPPKEDLVEKYFHPDNMSSSEKMKIELKKVRDEFKMSESDCGSARVQVAQLTTKIKHLSAALHKKDKHSLKGLQAMVQRRKKLLKYLRRTDWDSYCFVLSKLGLRDNPDYRN